MVFFSICVQVYQVKDCTIPPNNSTLRTTFGGIHYYKISIILEKFLSITKDEVETSKPPSFENQIPLQWYFVNNTKVFGFYSAVNSIIYCPIHFTVRRSIDVPSLSYKQLSLIHISEPTRPY